VSTPAPATVPQTLRADGIETQRVRANTIYANKIEGGGNGDTIYYRVNNWLGSFSQDRILENKKEIKSTPSIMEQLKDYIQFPHTQRLKVDYLLANLGTTKGDT
jgi:hypothetical protein